MSNESSLHRSTAWRYHADWGVPADGRAAYLAGWGPDSCPHAPGTREEIAWDNAWWQEAGVHGRRRPTHPADTTPSEWEPA